jgi:hypothetical protein
MKTNIKVRNFLDKHRLNITLAAHTDTMLFSELERLFQEMYDLGHSDGWAEGYLDALSEMNYYENL